MGRKTTDETAPNPLAAAVDALLEQARDLREEKENLYERIDASRTMLRKMVTMGNVTPEQANEIEDIYPARQRKGEDGEDTPVEVAPADEVVA